MEDVSRLNIRAFSGGDLPALYDLLSDEDVMRHIEPPYTLSRTKDFLERAGLGNPPLIYAVEDGHGRFIGYVIYHDYDEDSKEIGWILKKEVWGRGYAKALTRMLLARARSEGKAAVLECAPEQGATKHIAAATGFIYVGRRDGCDVYRHENI